MPQPVRRMACTREGVKQILFPVDFSPPCDALAPAVAALTRRFGAKLSLLHVMPTGTLEDDLDRFQHHFGTLAEEVQGVLANYQSALFEGVRPDRVFKIGRPAAAIVEYARENSIELIAMPTHGRTRFRELLLGSVTTAVLHDTDSAVLTTAHAVGAAPWRLPRSIVCAIDLGPLSTSVLDMADHFAIHCGAQLHVVHAVTGAITRGAVDEAKARYPALAAPAEVTQPLEILYGEAVTPTILAACQRHGADLLVVGRGQMQELLGRLRSGVHDIIRASPCPVLSV